MRASGSFWVRAAFALACVVAATGCSDDDGEGATPDETAGTGSGSGGSSTGGRSGGSDGTSSGVAGRAGGAGGASGTGGTRSAPGAGDGNDAGTLTDAGGGDADAGTTAWWQDATWKPVEWSPGMCVISALEDPTVITPLQWKPMMLGALAGETPVVPLGHRYEEDPDGTSWVTGPNGSGQSVVAVRDPDGEPIMGFQSQGCGSQVFSTRRGTACCSYAPSAIPAQSCAAISSSPIRSSNSSEATSSARPATSSCWWGWAWSITT